MAYLGVGDISIRAARLSVAKAHPSYTVLSITIFSKMRSQTQYTEMLLEWGNIPLSDIACAVIFPWLLLASYMVLPGTFKSLQKSDNTTYTVALQERTETNGAL